MTMTAVQSLTSHLPYFDGNELHTTTTTTTITISVDVAVAVAQHENEAIRRQFIEYHYKRHHQNDKSLFYNFRTIQHLFHIRPFSFIRLQKLEQCAHCKPFH